MTVRPSSNWNTCQLVVANAPSRLALKHPPCSNVSSKEICVGHDIGPNKLYSSLSSSVMFAHGISTMLCYFFGGP